MSKTSMSLDGGQSNVECFESPDSTNMNLPTVDTDEDNSVEDGNAGDSAAQSFEMSRIRSEGDGERRDSVKSVKERKHSHQQLYGTSTTEPARGHHETSQLRSSLLDRGRSNSKVSHLQAVFQARGSLKPSPRSVEFLAVEDGSVADSKRDGVTSITSNGEIDVKMDESVSHPTNGVIIKQPTERVRTPFLASGTSMPTSDAVPTAGSAPTDGGGVPTVRKPKPKLQRRKSLNPRMMTPPGLEILDNKALLAVRQQMEMDIKGGCGVGNTYKIWDINDDQIFFATEESSCLCRWMCGPSRKFSLSLFSTQDDQVLTFHRTCCRCDCCCCLDCILCLQKLYVVDCLGRTLGAVKQKFSILNAKFDIVDHDNNVLFKVLGPCCPCRCSTEIYFQILNKTGERQIGRIQKKWGGDRTDNVNVDHEYFDITFPAKLDSVDKALIMGAAFLVDFMYLEMS